jgi:ribosomal protein S6--L-glutamate ligase
MLRLAVATDAETFQRVQDPFADRGIAAEYVRTDERLVDLTDPDEEWAGFDVGFVYPSRMMEGAVADALLAVPWVNDREAVLTSRNKAGVLAALGQAGVPVPETVVVSNPVDRADLVAAFERLDPPVVVKPNSTTRGRGVAKAHDLDSFLGICDYLDLVHDYRATDDRSFLVQEFLPDATDYRVMVLDGEYTGAVERRLPDDGSEAGRWKHNVHRGGTAVGVDLPADQRKLAERVAALLDIPFLGVDLLVSGDRTLVTETNARPTIDAATKYEPGFYDDLAALVRATAADR